MGAFLAQVGMELHAAVGQRTCWLVLGLGFVNLTAGLVFGTDWLPTFVTLDFINANFAVALWIVAVYLGSQPPAAPLGRGIAAKVLALAIVVGAMLAAAGTVAAAMQLWRAAAPVEMPQYASGLFANLGVSTLHLVALAVAMQAIVGRKWLAVIATASVWIVTNLAFEHPLLRFGAPINPASGMSGLEPFVASGIALGTYWSGCCIVLLAAGRQIARHRVEGVSAPHPLGPNTFAVVWIAAVAWVVSGGWILHNASIGDRLEAAHSTQPRSAFPHHAPQPDYSRLDLTIQFSPLERILTSHGSAIAVNRLDVSIPELHFGVPRALEVVALATTGELARIDEITRCHRYRLNRPLEPKETLKIEFGLKWTASAFVGAREPPRLLENGASVSTAELVPSLGCANDPHPFHTAPPVAYRARISTSLDQVAVTAGTLVRAWKENGWSFFEYEPQGPIPPLTTIHTGHYAIQREVRDDRLFEVFYHPKHRNNVDRMIDTARAAVAKRPASASDQRLIRMVEVPDYQPFRHLGFLGICTAETRRGPACPVPVDTGAKTRRGRGQAPPLRADPAERAVYETARMVLPYSERGYLLSTPQPSGSTPPRA